MLPLTNRIADQLNLTADIVALLEWDTTIFNNLVVPEGIDSQQVIDNILLNASDRPLLHPNPNWMKWGIGVWSKRMLPIWEKLLKTTQYEYDPIENYDRKEETTDTRNIGRDRTSRQTYDESVGQEREDDLSQNTTGGETTEHTVSAENVDTYQPESKDTRTPNLTVANTGTQNIDTNTNGTSNLTENEGTTETFKHTSRMHGNIGVTTTQQMIREERDIVRFDMIETIVRDWINEFCLYVW